TSSRFVGKKTACKPIRRHSVKLNLEPLEERWCPSTTTWDDLNHAFDDNWSAAGNWSNGLPGVSNTPVFDGNVSKHFCVVNVNTPTSMNLTIQNGFTGTLEINPSTTFSFNNFTDNNPSTDSFNVQFGLSGTSGGTLAVYGTATFYNMDLTDVNPTSPA